MGYTHYFAKLSCTKDLVEFADLAIKESNVSIKDPYGEGSPDLVSANPLYKIGFNGDREREEDFESFIVPFGDYCKTGRMPYDKVVTAILLAAIYFHVPGWKNIHSDGDSQDWEESGGVDLFLSVYNGHFAYGGRKKLQKEEVLPVIDMLNGLSACKKDKEQYGKLLSDIKDAVAGQKEEAPVTIQIRYHSNKIERLSYIGGAKSDWIDLRAAEDVKMKQGDFALISLGISVKLPKGYEMVIVPRSSTFKNFGILQTNSFGVIDETYCGDNDIIRFPALAIRDTEIHVNDRICQFRIQKHQPPVEFEEKEHLGGEDRGGFGSTGKN